jgi:hypothetical protein
MEEVCPEQIKKTLNIFYRRLSGCFSAAGNPRLLAALAFQAESTAWPTKITRRENRLAVISVRSRSKWKLIPPERRA